MSHLLRSNHVPADSVEDTSEMLLIIVIAVAILTAFLCSVGYCVAKTLPKAVLVERLPPNCHVYTIDGNRIT